MNDQLNKRKEFYEKILNSLPADITIFNAGYNDLFVNPGALCEEEYRKFIMYIVVRFRLDITERKAMEEKQDSMLKQLSAQNTQLIDFCNIVSHNLRAPLTNLSMLTDFIEKTEDQDEQKLLISKLRPVLDHLHATFNQLVESIQIKNDQQVTVEDLSLKDCIHKTVKDLQSEITRLDAELSVDVGDAEVVRLPAKYLYNILHNLLNNALKYHFPERRPVINIRAERNGDRVILSVSDNGLGIDLKRHKNTIFKIGKVFHRHPHGKGFGLFMTKTQVEAMGGRIWVDSMPGKGTTFFVEFKNINKLAS